MSRTIPERPALLLTADTVLAGGVARLAAAAGVRLEVVADAGAALPAWSGSAVVLVGADQVDEVARRPTPPHSHLHVVAFAPAPDAVFRAALRIGARSVAELPEAGSWLLETLAELSEGAAEQGRSVAVVPGSGGAGASVFAAALATVASETADVLLVDADPLGPGQRLLCGHDDEDGITWQDLAATTGRLGARALRDAVPRRHRLGVLGWAARAPGPPAADLVAQAVAAGARGHAWVILDLPRREEDVRGALAACEHTVVVTRAGIGCLASAARFLGGLSADLATGGLVVRRERDAPPAAEVAHALGLDLWAEMRDERRLEEHLVLGLGPAHAARGPLARTAARVLARCAAGGAGLAA